MYTELLSSFQIISTLNASILCGTERCKGVSEELSQYLHRAPAGGKASGFLSLCNSVPRCSPPVSLLCLSASALVQQAVSRVFCLAFPLPPICLDLRHLPPLSDPRPFAPLLDRVFSHPASGFCFGFGSRERPRIMAFILTYRYAVNPSICVSAVLFSILHGSYLPCT